MIGTRWPGCSCGPDRPGRGVAVHAGHPAVHEHGGEAVAVGEGGDRLDAVDGDLGGVAGVLQQADGDHLVDLVVLDDQDPLLRSDRPDATLGTRAGPPRASPVAVPKARGEAERAAAPGLALRAVSRPPRALDQLARDGQAEAGAAVAAGRRRVGLGEGVEEPLLGVARDARAGVGAPTPRARRRRRVRWASTVDRDPYPPRSVNFTALEPRLASTCADRIESPRTYVGTRGATIERQVEALLVGLAARAAGRSARRPRGPRSRPARARACRPRSSRGRGCR